MSISSNTNVYEDWVLFVISLHLIATLAGPSFNREDSQTLTWSHQDNYRSALSTNMCDTQPDGCYIQDGHSGPLDQGSVSHEDNQSVHMCNPGQMWTNVEPRRGKKRSVSERDNQTHLSPYTDLHPVTK